MEKERWVGSEGVHLPGPGTDADYLGVWGGGCTSQGLVLLQEDYTTVANQPYSRTSSQATSEKKITILSKLTINSNCI